MAKQDPNPDYIPAKTRTVRINGELSVEMDGEKWLNLLRDLAYWAQPKERKGKV